MSQEIEIEFDRIKVAQCYRIKVMIALSPFILFLGLGFILMYVYYRWIDQWFTQLLINSIKYSMDEKTIRAEKGIIYFRRVIVPLDQITDITIAQSPIMKYLDMWSLQIQTAGRCGYPEITLWGVFNPEQVRDEILTARETFLKSIKSMSKD
jgi:membrane protein YdbS with pleckstrin-like domain